MKELIFAIGALRDCCRKASLTEEMLPVVTLTFPNPSARQKFITTVKLESSLILADIFDANRRMFLREGIDMRIEGIDVRINDRVMMEAMIRSKFL